MQRDGDQLQDYHCYFEELSPSICHFDNKFFEKFSLKKTQRK